MATTDATADLQLSQKELKKIRAVVRSGLRASSFDEALIDRCADEAVGQSILEITEAAREGKTFENPSAAIVTRARWRAIDMLRREERESPAAVGADFVADTIDARGDAVDEEGILNVERRDLRAVVKSLPVDQRKALRMYYFKELSTREGAKALAWSEATFRRRLKDALKALRDHLGVVDPKQGDALGIEIGSAASASFMVRRFADQVVVAGEHLQAFVGRVLAGGGGETATGTTGHAIGRAVGGCAAALGICAVTGVIGPGLGDLVHPDQPPPKAIHSGPEGSARPAATSAVVVAPPVPPPASTSQHGGSAGKNSSSTSRRANPKRVLGDESGTKKERTKAANRSLGVESGASPPVVEEAPPAPEEAPSEPVLGDESGSPSGKTSAASKALGGY